MAQFKIIITDEEGEVYTESHFNENPRYITESTKLSSIWGKDDEGDDCDLTEIIKGAAKWVEAKEAK